MTQTTKTRLIIVAVIVGVFGLIGGYRWIMAQREQSNTSVSFTGTDTDTSTPVTDTPQAPAATPTPPCFTAAQSWNEIGQSGCVEFTVGSTYVSSRCNAYLDQYSDYSSGFSAWIPDGCSLGNALISEYANKTIEVSGSITRYDGAPEIEVTSASQVQLH